MRAPGLCLCAAALALLAEPALAAQSALHPRGLEAERVALLTWILFYGSVAICAFVFGCTALAMIGGERWRRRLRSRPFLIGAGVWFPVVTLTIVFFYGLFLLRAGAAPQGEGEPVQISVIGEQWWWRVVYEGPDGETFETANELRIPVGRPVEIALTTEDVIHSFWVPALAGKLDMIPGRVNTLTVSATEAGVMRGQCAEYCGGAHALMSFYVVALPPDEYETWLAETAGDARPPQTPAQQEGQQAFLAAGCGGCHAVRGTQADGVIGPDLTHIGQRISLAAAVLPNTREAMVRWIRDNQHIKPENKMLDYGFLSEAEAAAVADYLEGLE